MDPDEDSDLDLGNYVGGDDLVLRKIFQPSVVDFVGGLITVKDGWWGGLGQYLELMDSAVRFGNVGGRAASLYFVNRGEQVYLGIDGVGFNAPTVAQLAERDTGDV